MSKLYDLLYAMIGKLNSSVKTTPQTMTEAEKTQARTNIGAQPAGDYATKKDIPTVPTKLSAFTNDVGYLTQHQNLSAYAKKDEIPSKLPNPHALTINGKTYDGSSAVSVTVEGGSGGGGADWNASEGEPGHVKHRTHWIDVDIVEILPETQAKIQSSQYDKALSFVPMLEVKQGDIISVAINGMEYKCAAQAYQNNVYVFGDGNYFGFGSSGAGEPFCVLYKAGSNSGVYVKQDCTISIYKDNSIIHKLDKKYLPDNIGGGADWNASEGEPGHVLNRTHWVEGGVKEIFAETLAIDDEGTAESFSTIPLTAGETYTVNWNGTEYTCVAQDFSAMTPGAIGLGNFAIMGLADTGEPFVVIYSQEANATLVFALDGTVSTEVPISIHTAEVVHKLDNKFIDAEWMATTQKRAGDTLFSGTADVYPGGGFMGGTPKNVLIGLVPGETYFVNIHGEEYVCVAKSVPGNNEGWMDTVYIGDGSQFGGEATGEPFVIADAQFSDDDVHGFFTGGVQGVESGTIPVVIKKVDVVPNKLDPKFLPDGVGGVMVVSIKSLDVETGEIFMSHTAGEIANAMGAGKIVFMNIEGMPFIVNGDVESDGDGNITGVGFNVINAPTVTARVDANGEVTISEAQ